MRHVIEEWQKRNIYTSKQIEDAGGREYLSQVQVGLGVNLVAVVCKHRSSDSSESVVGWKRHVSCFTRKIGVVVVNYKAEERGARAFQ